MNIPTCLVGKLNKLLLIFSRRSFTSMLLFNLSSEIVIADDALSKDNALATRLIVSRSRIEIKTE